MSDWSERFENSPIWKALSDLGPALDNAENRDAIEPQSIEAIARLRAALTFVGKRLAATDPFLIQPGPVENAAGQIQNAVSEVQQFTANGSHGHLTNANSQMDSALAYIAQLNVPLGPSELQGLKDAADQYRNSLEANAKRAAAAVATVTNDSQELGTKLKELSGEMAAERQRLSSLTADFQSQFSTAQEARNSDYTAAQASRQEKFAELVATATEALTKQDAAFTRDREKMAQEHASALKALREGHETKAQEILGQIQDYRADVEKLVGVIGNLGVTSGYLQTANEAKITVRVWQGITVASMIALIGVAYRVFVPEVRGPFSWEGFAGRIFFTLSVGVLAAYAATQADKYQSLERRNRALALELEALGPYLAPLPEDKQQEFRLTVGDRTFGREQGGSEHPDKSPATVIDLLLKSKEFRTFVTDIVRAARGG
ncbi:MAG TPA: hypothetical protein VGX03_08540 [Candidatus Binatia bacterium]|jgi:hypothetical protein|nr:hypothetical protein [Candidatus Binatia bacterium]